MEKHYIVIVLEEEVFEERMLEDLEKNMVKDQGQYTSWFWSNLGIHHFIERETGIMYMPKE